MLGPADAHRAAVDDGRAGPQAARDRGGNGIGGNPDRQAQAAIDEVAQVRKGGRGVTEVRIGADAIAVGVIPRLRCAGDPQGGKLAERPIQGVAQGGALQTADERRHEVHGSLAQDAIRLAMLVALEAPTVRVGRPAADPRHRKSGARRPRRVPIVTHEVGRPAIHGLVQAGGHAGQLRLAPAAPAHPGIRGQLLRGGTQAGNNGSAVGGVVERDGQGGSSQVHEVNVEVVEAGNDRRVANVDEPRTGRNRHLVAAAGLDHAAIGNGDGLRRLEALGVGCRARSVRE